jgi:hypothetical protein
LVPGEVDLYRTDFISSSFLWLMLLLGKSSCRGMLS